MGDELVSRDQCLRFASFASKVSEKLVQHILGDLNLLTVLDTVLAFELDKPLYVALGFSVSYDFIQELVHTHRVVKYSPELVDLKFVVVEGCVPMDHIEHKERLARVIELVQTESDCCLHEGILRIAVHDVTDLMKGDFSRCQAAGQVSEDGMHS